MLQPNKLAKVLGTVTFVELRGYPAPRVPPGSGTAWRSERAPPPNLHRLCSLKSLLFGHTIAVFAGVRKVEFGNSEFTLGIIMGTTKAAAL